MFREKQTTSQGSELIFLCISDLHGNVYEPDNRPILELVKEAKPDLILASGDILSGEDCRTDEVAVSLLSQLLAVAPVCYVNGNHEIQLRKHEPKRYRRYIERLENCGVQVLNNRSIQMEIKEQKICVYGYELPLEFYRRFNRKKPEVSAIKNAIGTPDKSAINILLTHNPMHFEEYAQWGADVVFAGHLHGGFIRLPHFGGVISPQIHFFPKYDKGIFVLRQSVMVVSAGLGNHSGLFRINNPTETVVLTMRK